MNETSERCENPILLLIAGPHGAGKTKLIEGLARRGIDVGELVSISDIRHQIRGDTKETRGARAKDAAHLMALACTASQRDFCFETTLSDSSDIEIVQTARAEGFFIKLIFVGTEDPEIGSDRIHLRGLQDYVPRQEAIAGWYKTMENLAEVVALSDKADIFDNSRPSISRGNAKVLFSWDRVNDQWRILSCEGNLKPPPWLCRFVLAPLGIGGLYDLDDLPPHGEVFSPSPRTLLEMNPNLCHWPLGDPSRDDFAFCGNPAMPGFSYCSGHARAAYG